MCFVEIRTLTQNWIGRFCDVALVAFYFRGIKFVGDTMTIHERYMFAMENIIICSMEGMTDGLINQSVTFFLEFF